MLKKLQRYWPVINCVIIILLLLIHFVFREMNHYFSLLFYAFPLPVIICITLSFVFTLKGKLKYYNLILTFILLAIWCNRSLHITATNSIKENDTEIVFWNATHKREFKHVFDACKSLPDLVVLVEYHAEEIGQIKAKHPSAYFYWHEDSEIGVFSKAPISVKEIVVSKHKSVIINFTTQRLNCFAVDVNSSLLVSRQEELAFVNRTILNKQPSIVLGDFNLPYESIFFNTIKANFNHVLTKKGNGFRETWFWNIPLLSLDHIWVSKDLNILNADKMSTWKSDHSMIKTVIQR